MRLKTIKAMLRGNELFFTTSSGTFSKSGIDRGTEILIGHSEIASGQKILDLGCGYGPVGIAIAKAFPDCRVTMTDINQRAVKLARQNIRLNQIENAEAVSGNLYEGIRGKFDAILLNPPQSAGRKLCFEMIEESPVFLKGNGSLQLIARKNKGGEVLGEKMKEVFGNVSVLAKKSGYWLYISRKGHSKEARA